MQVEHYEPLVRQLCQGIRDPHVRSEAEQEGRIALWRYGARVDAAANPEAYATATIVNARYRACVGRLWQDGIGNRKTTECSNGHPISESKLDCLGRNICMACRRDVDRRRRQRKKAS